MDSIYSLLMFGAAGSAIAATVIAAGYYSGGLSKDVIVHCGLLARHQAVQFREYLCGPRQAINGGPRTLKRPSQSSVPVTQVSLAQQGLVHVHGHQSPEGLILGTQSTATDACGTFTSAAGTSAFSDLKSFQDTLKYDDHEIQE
jgi:hypothetical protein